MDRALKLTYLDRMIMLLLAEEILKGFEFMKQAVASLQQMLDREIPNLGQLIWNIV